MFGFCLSYTNNYLWTKFRCLRPRKYQKPVRKIWSNFKICWLGQHKITPKLNRNFRKIIICNLKAFFPHDVYLFFSSFNIFKVRHFKENKYVHNIIRIHFYCFRLWFARKKCQNCCSVHVRRQHIIRKKNFLLLSSALALWLKNDWYDPAKRFRTIYPCRFDGNVWIDPAQAMWNGCVLINHKLCGFKATLDAICQPTNHLSIHLVNLKLITLRSEKLLKWKCSSCAVKRWGCIWGELSGLMNGSHIACVLH